ncbi:MAG: hypothetical protein NTU91_07595 [Chloroflexi bacterium]|nr:hypothetical protein [Chloroflexota bacterium]
MEIVLGLVVIVVVGLILRKVNALALGAGASAIVMLMDYQSTYATFVQTALASGSDTLETAKMVATLVVAFEFVLFALAFAAAIWLVRKAFKPNAEETKAPPGPST